MLWYLYRADDSMDGSFFSPRASLPFRKGPVIGVAAVCLSFYHSSSSPLCPYLPHLFSSCQPAIRVCDSALSLYSLFFFFFFICLEFYIAGERNEFLATCYELPGYFDRSSRSLHWVQLLLCTVDYIFFLHIHRFVLFLFFYRAKKTKRIFG